MSWQSTPPSVCEPAMRAGPIALQLLISPVADYRFDYPSMIENAEGYMLTTSAVRWFWRHYLRGPEDTTDPLAVPMRAGDLAGLPPAIIVTAEFDPLRDEGETYADRLAEAGVPTIKRRYDGMVHAFVLMGRYVDASAALLDDLGRDVRDVLARMRNGSRPGARSSTMDEEIVGELVVKD
jgi:acetyl esterase